MLHVAKINVNSEPPTEQRLPWDEEGQGGAAGADLPLVPPRGSAEGAAGPRGKNKRAWHPTRPGGTARTSCHLDEACLRTLAGS